MLLEMAASGFADRPILGWRGEALTVGEVDDLAHGGAALLRDCGAEALLYLDVNGPAFPVALFAAARAGVPFVPLNYRLGAAKLDALVARHPRALVLGAPGSPAGESAAVLSAAEWLARARERGSRPGVPPAAEPGPAVVIYTSGTTATPKGVLLSHENLMGYVFGSVEFASADERDAALVSLPPYHIAAVANALTNLYAGRRCVVLDQFTAADWLSTARDEHITQALVVPTMLARIVEHPDGASAPPALRSVAYGGAHMPQPVIERALRNWPGVDFVNAYGLTETSSTIAVLGPEDHRTAMASDAAAVRARLGSVGKPVPSVQIEIRDTEGTGVAAGGTGRIWVRGEQVSGRYAGAVSGLDADGWFDTRDDGYLDGEGYLFVVGRADDTIIRGGENIAPAEIEDVLRAFDGIDDAVAVGVPDPEWGEHIEAVVVAAAGRRVDPDAVLAFARARLRGSRTPDRLVVWERIPRTETGKILRREVVERLADEL